MSKYPEHNKEYFYKFTTMDTARLILDNQKFRYTSPLAFNDPFDIQTELYFNFDVTNLPHLITEEVDALVCGRRKEELNSESDFCKAIMLLQEKHQEGRYKRKDLDYLVKPLMNDMADIFEGTRQQYNAHWQNILKTIKVFCVSEHNESTLMWSHYAKYHTGVCFKLKVMPEKDNPICVAKEVNYLPTPPCFFNVEEWIDSIVIAKEVDFTGLYYSYPLAKSDIWAYENEWRVWAPFEEDGNNYLDMPINDGEIESVYFGMNADNKLINEIIGIAKEIGVVKYYKATKKVKEYGLVYNEI